MIASKSVRTGILKVTLLLTALMGAEVVGSAAAAAQQGAERLAVSDTIWEIRLADGSTLFGRVTAADPDRITLTTEAGVRVELERAQIRSAVPVRGAMREGEVWLDDRHATRLFFGPTGRTLAAGEGNAGVYELFFPFFAIGATDWLTVAGGTPIIPELIGEVFYLAPKLRVLQRERLDLAVGVLAFVNTDDVDPASAGLLYAVGTYGDLNDAVTLGAGWGFTGDEVSNRPAFLVGGETRVGRRVKLLTENYLISYTEENWVGPDQIQRETSYVTLLSAGLRVFGERLSADAGLGLGIGEGETLCCLPLVNFVYTFGGDR